MELQVIDNRYEVLSSLGKGSIGEVYKVKDIKENKVCALKVLYPTSSDAILGFKNEFKLIANLRHPNLCEVYDFGYFKKNYYYTMEYIDGTDIYNGTKRLKLEEIYQIVAQVLRALEFIHSRGYIHYDIKPGNILLTKDGNAKLIDFGLAREEIKDGIKIKGTVPYLAPEVLKGTWIDHRADLYSFGVVLYEVFTRRQIEIPKNISLFALFKKIENGIISEPVEKYNPEIPPKLGELILRLIHPEPSYRPSSANDVIKEMNKFSKEKFDIETGAVSYILSSRFIDREKELELLQGAFNRKEPNVILVSGEQGVGKTRLLREFKFFVQLNGCHCLDSYAQSESSLSYSLYYEVVRSLLSYININSLKRRTLTVLSHLFTELFDPQIKKALPPLGHLEPQQEKLRIYDALTELVLKAAGKIKNLVIILEDIHWADEPSLLALEYLIRNIKGTNILVLLSYQENIENPFLKKTLENIKCNNNHKEIELKPFGPNELREFLDSIIPGKKKQAQFIQYLLEETKGNPFFIEEMVRMLYKEKGIMDEDMSVEVVKSLSLPKGIEGVIKKGLLGLSEDALSIVKACSAVRGGFDLQLISEIVPLEEARLHSAIQELLKRRILIKDDGHYSFYNLRTRDVLLKELDLEEKKRLNYKIGRFLEENDKENLLDLANYFLNSGDREKGIEYGLAAAKSCIQNRLYEDGVEFYKVVLDLIQEEGERLNILISLADIETKAGHYDDAIFHYKQALNSKDLSTFERIGLYEKIAGVCIKKGEYSETLEFADKGIESMKDAQLEPLLKCKLYLRKVASLFYMNSYEDAKISALETLRFLKELEDNKEKIKIEEGVYSFLGVIESELGNYEKGSDWLKKALCLTKSIKEEIDVAAISISIGNLYFQKGDYQNALTFYQDALQGYEELGDLRGLLTALLNIGNIQAQLADWQTALENYKKSLEIAKRIGNREYITIGYRNIGDCYAQLHDFSKAEDSYQEALNLSKTSEARAYILNSLGDLYLNKGEFSKALKNFQTSLDIVKEMKGEYFILYNTHSIAVTFVEIGELKEAKKNLNECLDVAEEKGLKEILIYVYRELCLISLFEEKYDDFYKFFVKGKDLSQRIEKKDVYVDFLLLSAEYSYLKENYNDGIKNAEEGIAAAKEMDNKLTYARALLAKIKNSTKYRSFSKVEESMEEVLGIAKELHDRELLWKVYHQYAIFYKEQGMFIEAIKYLKKAIETFKEICKDIIEEDYKISYLSRPDRKCVFQTVDELENLFQLAKNLPDISS